jgi:hypothetical protein
MVQAIDSSSEGWLTGYGASAPEYREQGEPQWFFKENRNGFFSKPD